MLPIPISELTNTTLEFPKTKLCYIHHSVVTTDPIIAIFKVTALLND